MAHIVYEVIRHDGGWAYRMGSTVSETFANEELAFRAAKQAAEEQRAPGEGGPILYETEDGKWREETARGDDRPETDVRDESAR